MDSTGWCPKDMMMFRYKSQLWDGITLSENQKVVFCLSFRLSVLSWTTLCKNLVISNCAHTKCMMESEISVNTWEVVNDNLKGSAVKELASLVTSTLEY